MSLYSHYPSGYGNIYSQQPQPQHVYAHQTQAAPTYPYAHQPYPVYFSDSSSYRREYTARLSELTMNSRPIIQNLSMMAQNYVRYADIVAECLQAHIRRVPPWMKLPAFYVLDAISKNVFEPYAAKFSAFVVPLFLETFGEVDAATRSKMEEMLVTWRTGAPSGKELFGVANQVSIERQIWGGDSSSALDTNSRRQGHTAPLTKSQVLAELDVTLALKEQAFHANPYDSTAQTQIGVLHQLRRMVELGVSQEELKQILAQLRAMSRETTSAPPPPVHPSIPSPPVYNGIPSAPSTSYGHSTAAQAQHSVFSPSDSLNQQISLPGAASSAPVSGISGLFQSLMKAGLVSGNSTPIGAGKETSTPPPTNVNSDDAKSEVDNKLDVDRIQSRRSHAKAVLDMRMRLTTAEITRKRHPNVSMLYNTQPIKCKQCGSRFPEGGFGKKRLEDHLDMHFRQNRRAKENIGRGYSRSWFVGIQNWIFEPLVDVKGKHREFSTLGKAASGSLGEADALLRASTVVVPPGDEAKTFTCPVCKEVLKSEFQEEEEEWVWRNAIRVKDKIFHATCHAELATSSTLASSLRAEGFSGLSSSRSGTPESALRPGTPNKTPVGKSRFSKSPSPVRNISDAASKAGLKRKAEAGSTQHEVGDPATHTPPLKKMALTLA